VFKGRPGQRDRRDRLGRRARKAQADLSAESPDKQGPSVSRVPPDNSDQQGSKGRRAPSDRQGRQGSSGPQAQRGRQGQPDRSARRARSERQEPPARQGLRAVAARSTRRYSRAMARSPHPPASRKCSSSGMAGAAGVGAVLPERRAQLCPARAVVVVGQRFRTQRPYRSFRETVSRSLSAMVEPEERPLLVAKSEPIQPLVRSQLFVRHPAELVDNLSNLHRPLHSAALPHTTLRRFLYLRQIRILFQTTRLAFRRAVDRETETRRRATEAIRPCRMLPLQSAA
jgi:hypothetical protein